MVIFLAKMEIQYLGHACFRIKGKSAVLLTDPYSPQIGLKMAKTTADIVTVSHQHFDHNETSLVVGTPSRPQPFIISDPGEYEVAGVFVYGLPSFHDQVNGAKRGENTIYVISMDDLRLAHLGDLGHRLTEEQIEGVNGVDVLFVPVGGECNLNANQAMEVIGQIEPKIVIPMHYQIPGSTYQFDSLENFLKVVGVEVKPIDKLVVNKGKLPEERMVVVLNARTKNSPSS